MVVVKFLVFVSEVVSIFSKILTWIIGGVKRIPLPHQLSYWGARAPAAPLSLRLWSMGQNSWGEIRLAQCILCLVSIQRHVLINKLHRTDW